MICTPLRRLLLLLAIVSAGTPLATLASAMPATPTVEITKFAFTPGEITISPGTTIVWTNHDEVPHTVTSTDKRLASKALDTDDRFEHTFADAGDYTYFCAVHPFMTGVVHVRNP
ncbi:MAG: cupredoxin family copper-binding protein [Dokdonella sp.]